MASSNHQLLFTLLFSFFFLSPHYFSVIIPSSAINDTAGNLTSSKPETNTTKPPASDVRRPSDDDDIFRKARRSSKVLEILTARIISLSGHRLKRAHLAIRAWKQAIVRDPKNFTGNWHGPNVCAYNGITCAPSPRHLSQHVVAGIDFNNASMGGHLPVDLRLFKDVVLIHVNSNRFMGKIPRDLSSLEHLEELDLSNNDFAGPFPMEVLKLPKLRYLDLRFNNFEGPIPPELFDKGHLDAIFLNNNRFNSTLPENIGNSKASVIVLADNDLEGLIPTSLEKMGATLRQIILKGNKFSGCIPHELGFLGKLNVLDLGFNSFVGTLSKWTVIGLHSVEQLNVAGNSLTGVVPDSVCRLRHLANFTYSSNYFRFQELKCAKYPNAVFDGKNNCMVGQQGQRTAEECALVLAKPPVNCRRLKRSRILASRY